MAFRKNQIEALLEAQEFHVKMEHQEHRAHKHTSSLKRCMDIQQAIASEQYKVLDILETFRIKKDNKEISLNPEMIDELLESLNRSMLTQQDLNFDHVNAFRHTMALQKSMGYLYPDIAARHAAFLHTMMLEDSKSRNAMIKRAMASLLSSESDEDKENENESTSKSDGDKEYEYSKSITKY